MSIELQSLEIAAVRRTADFFWFQLSYHLFTGNYFNISGITMQIISRWASIALLVCGAASISPAAFAQTQSLSWAPVIPTNWSGPSVGLIGTGAWGSSTQTDPGFHILIINNNNADGRYNLSGGMGGVGAGFNWQSGHWVYGIVGDISGGNISGSSNVCGLLAPFLHPCGTNLDTLGTLRGQLGYAVGSTGNWMPYVTGGLAVGNVHGWDALTLASGTATQAGWTAGVGVAVMAAPHWVLKLEYLHVDLGSSNLFNVVPGVPETVSFKADLVRFGVSYQFNAEPATPPAKLWTKAK